MTMTVHEVHEQKTWDAFVSALPWAQFTQSWAWGEFQASRGLQIKRVFVVDGKKTMAACQLVRRKRGPIVNWFAPRGPVFRAEAVGQEREVLKALCVWMEKHGCKSRALYWRFEPLIRFDQGGGALPMRFLLTHALEPACTSLVHLDQTEEQLLAAMHSKTRYNIRVAERHGVTVREGSGEADVEAFLSLIQETASRDQFRPLHQAYLKATYTSLAEAGISKLRLAEKDGQLLAASMEMHFGDTVTYLHGASSSKDREAMAPYALHWEAIKSARAAGAKLYDFYGLNPEHRSSPHYKESWEGITRFKRGFGGEQVDLVGTWDMPVWRVPYLLLMRGHWTQKR